MPSSFFHLSFFFSCLFFLFVSLGAGVQVLVEGFFWLFVWARGVGCVYFGFKSRLTLSWKVTCGKQMRISIIPEVFLKRPDKFDKKNRLQKNPTFSLLKQNKVWFYCEKNLNYYQWADFLVQTNQHPSLNFVLLVSSISFVLWANHFFSELL